MGLLQDVDLTNCSDIEQLEVQTKQIILDKLSNDEMQKENSIL